MNNEPVIKQALGDQWDQLSTIIQQHYDISPGIPGSVVMAGVMEEVYHSRIAKGYIFIGRIFGALIPYKGVNIPVEVKNWTNENDPAMFWFRTFQFPNKAVIFSSHMVYECDNQIIEFVRFGMGVRMKMSVRQGALVFKGVSYCLKFGSIKFTLPNWMLLGDAEISETAIDSNYFRVDFRIIHPLFGRTFAYSGNFKIVDNTA